jgi:hypothetical protein
MKSVQIVNIIGLLLHHHKKYVSEHRGTFFSSVLYKVRNWTSHSTKAQCSIHGVHHTNKGRKKT